MEIELYHVHEHPLTLCEIEGDDAACPVCDHSYCFDGYNCSDCEFHPDKCSVCGGKPSGSFYFCKRCWPKSPLFHRSCAKLPKEIQIAFRPLCSLQYVREESRNSVMPSYQREKSFLCDFCDKSHKGIKFCCDLCNFQICTDCAMILIKYHHDRQHIQHFSHHHPLILLEIDKEGTVTECKMCCKYIHGQSYCCAPCEFYIHKSCGELLPEVRHPFHPLHALTLKEFAYSSLNRCHVCCFYTGQGVRYRCDACNFDMHPECRSLKPNIEYEGHHHLLTLVEDMCHSSKCQACSFEIENTFFVRCVQCRIDFHVQCGPATASLPPVAVHKNHNHRLSLIIETNVKDDSILSYCEICKEDRNPKHPSYGCVECEYYAHIRCVITEIHLDERERERERVKHFSHRHFLFLLKSKRNDDIKCYACDKLIESHPIYGCECCEFYLHKSCLQLPKMIYHESDSHYLSLQDSFYSNVDYVCKACKKDLSGFIYRCNTCDFDLDLDCASQHPSIKWKAYSDESEYDEDRQGIGLYSHYHNVTLSEVSDKKCELCYKNIHGASYGCAPCMFYIHKQCGEVPQEIQHPFHPHHSLTLGEYTSSKKYYCDACRFDTDPGRRFRCQICDFDLHLECASLRPNIKYEGHLHLVILVENMSYVSNCRSCLRKIEGTFFVRCVECRFDFHVQCGAASLSLPSTVVNLHHDHSLTLTLATETVIKDGYGLLYCDVCKEERNPIHPSYSCVECEYYAHARCVVTEVLLDKREKVEHFSHDHFLFLVENERSDDITCYACQKLIQTNPAYGCDQCRYYLHKSCVELPRQIQHLFHRHPLTLKCHPDEDTKYHQCGVCNKILCGFHYQCGNCFVMDVDCASLQLDVKSDEHILNLFGNLQHSLECRKYISATTGAMDRNCVKCNFVVYLLRSPLPQNIECTSHLHSLTLMANINDDNYGSQNCDVCEEERDPEVCVYYCEECDFIAEFVCVISEVILALQKKQRDVPLKYIGRKTIDKGMSKSLTYQDIQDSFTDEEEQKWKDILQAFNEEFEEIRKKFSGADLEAKVTTLEKFVYSDEDFLHRLAVLSDGAEVNLLTDEERKGVVIDVRDYKIIPRLAGVLKDLLDKYGDIGASCILAESHSNLKTCFMNNFCSTVHSMCNTIIQDVDYPLLYTWWTHFNVARRTGFKVDFFFTYLKRIMHARHEIDTKLQQIMISSINDDYVEMAKYSKEIDELAQEIDKRKVILDVFRKQTHDRISNISFQKLRLETEQLSYAREIGMMKAGLHCGLP